MSIEYKIREPERVRGGYQISVIGKAGDEEHGEICGIYKNDGPEGKLTSDNLKAVARRLVDETEVLEPAVAAQPAVPADVDERGEIITPAKPAVPAKPEVRSKSARQRMEAYFAGREAVAKDMPEEVKLKQVPRKRRDGSVVKDKEGRPELVADDTLE